MKQKLTQGLYVLVFIFFAQLLAAQDFGIRAGLNYADISGIEEGSDAIIGLQFGPVAEFGLSESINLNVAALYAMKGAQDPDPDSDSKIKSNYIDVPILLHYDFGGFYAELGPQMSILLSADGDGEDVKELFKSSDFSAIIGIGYDLGSLRIDARYGIGLSNITKSEYSFYNDESLKNKVITLGVSYMFGGASGSDEE